MKNLILAAFFIVSSVASFNCYGQNLSEVIQGEWHVDSIYTFENSFSSDSIFYNMEGKDLIIKIKAVDAFKCHRSKDTVRFVMRFRIVNSCGWAFNLRESELVFCDTQCTAMFCAKDKEGSPCKRQLFEQFFGAILREMKEIQQESDSLRILSESGAKIFLTPIEY